MASQGHIKIDRRILGWEWYKDSNMVHVFLHLLLNANYTDSRFEGSLIKRGQLVIGRLKLATALGLTERQIRTCLEKLKKTNEIAIKTTNRFSVVTIIKYDDYQSSPKKSDQQGDHKIDQQATNKRPTSDQQATTSNNDEEGNKEKKEEIQYAFSSNEFKECFNEWIQFRKEKKKSLTPLTIKKQNVFLLKYPESVAIQIIEKSITNGWSGLFEPKDGFLNNQSGRQKTPYEIELEQKRQEALKRSQSSVN